MIEQDKFSIYNFKELMSLDLLPNDFVIRPILPIGGIALIYASPGAGKSMLTLSLALSAASGKNLMVWRIKSPKRVLYIDGEMLPDDARERIRNIVRGHELFFDINNFRYLSLPMQKTSKLQSADFSAVDVQDLISNELEGIDLLVLDNLSTLTKIQENESCEWLKMQDWLLKLRGRGISVIVVHHSGKSGDQRGTSRREDIMNTIISLKKVSDEEVSNDLTIKVEYVKCRGFYGEDSKSFMAKFINTDAGNRWEYILEKRTNAEIVKDLLGLGMGVNDIMLETGLSRASVYRLKKLC